MRVSKHISIHEAITSPTALRLGIDNTPSPEVLATMKLTAKNVFEPLREWYGKPIRINSFYRSAALNKAVKGSRTSQHIIGEAIDISAGSKVENKKLFDWLIKNVTFDQVINEYDFTWVHVSYKKTGNRKQVLKIG